MGLKMTSPTKRSGTNSSQYRIRIPKDLLKSAPGKQLVCEFDSFGSKPFLITVKVGPTHIQFSLQTTDDAVTKARCATADDHVMKFFKNLRSEPTKLSQRQVAELAGEVYHLFVEKFYENPGSPDAWAAFKAFNRAASEGRLLSLPQITDQTSNEVAEARDMFGKNLTEGVNAHPKTNDFEPLENRFGWLTNWVLTKHSLVINLETRVQLLFAVSEAATIAARHLKKTASGDYSPDPQAQRFPAVRLKAATSLDELFEKWMVESSPSASTLQSWRPVITHLKEHLRHQNPANIKPEAIVVWKNKLLAEGRQPKTVNGTYLACFNAIMAYGISNKLVAENPAKGIKALVSKKAGTRKLPYADAEVGQLLLVSQQSDKVQYKWLIWLAASTGARIGELAQLWCERITDENGVPTLKITPAEDGGSIKNETSERTVPIHPDLISEGFLEFVARKGNGPLFYRKNSTEAGSRHASKGVSNRLAGWIREQGFNDPRQAPIHALRHWFKSAASRLNIQDSVTNAIQGHTTTDSAATYLHFNIPQLAEAIAKIPIKSLIPVSAQEKISPDLI